MSETSAPPRPVRSSRFGPALPPRTFAGFAAAVVTVLLIAVFGYRSLDSEAQNAALTTHTMEVLQRVDGLFSSLKDAETGQRGYLLTAEESYLEPYSNARASIPGQLQELKRLTANSPRQQELLSRLEHFSADTLSELARTIDRRRTDGSAAALAEVRTDRGKAAMDRIREVVGQMIDEDRALLSTRIEASRQATALSLYIDAGGSALLFLLIGTAGFLTSRDFLTQQTEAWLQAGQTGLSERMQGEQRLEMLGDNILGFLARYLDAQVSAIYLAQADGRFRRCAALGLTHHGEKSCAVPPRRELLTGQVA